MLKHLFNKDYVSLKAPGGWGYSGDVNNLKKAGKSVLEIGMGAGALFFAFDCGKRAYNYFFNEKEKEAEHRRKMDEKKFDHQAKMEEAAQKNKFKQEEMNLEQKHWCEKRSKVEVPSVDSDIEQSAEAEPDDELVTNPSWLDNFLKKVKMPKLHGIMDTLVNGICPIGYEPAMLLHLMSMFGALCFSKVRAKYLDGQMHAPNLQVVIEGGWGSGKGKFETIYKLLFSRNINADRDKINRSDEEEGYSPIVQTAGIGLSGAKLVDVLADNHGVHFYIFSSEILSVIQDLKKKTGLTFDHFRKAFENGDVYNNNKAKNSKKGLYPVFFNYTFTGTPVDVSKFIGGEVEGGSASRIGWGVIPENGREIAKLDMPSDAELDKIRDQIDDWKSKYCYSTVNGKDTPCAETVIDLGYVNVALDKWLTEQYDLSAQEKNPARADARPRISAMAFHAAMVIAMIYGNPSAKEYAKREAVVNLALYIANMCMERFLHTFAAIQNEQRSEAAQAEKAKSKVAETGQPESDGEFTEADVKEWIRLNKEERMGYQKIADKFKTTKDVVAGRIRRYLEKNSVK